MLGIVASSMPKSNDITILGRYIVWTLMLGAIAVVASVLIDFVVHKVSASREEPFAFKITKDYDTDAPPDWLYKVLFVRKREYKSAFAFENGDVEKKTSYVFLHFFNCASVCHSKQSEATWLRTSSAQNRRRRINATINGWGALVDL